MFSNERKTVNAEFNPKLSDSILIDEKLTSELNKATLTQKEKYSRYTTELAKIKANLKQAEFELTNGQSVIGEFCRDLKSDVQLAKEQKIKELEDLAERIMSEIDTFQKEKLQSLLNAHKAEYTT